MTRKVVSAGNLRDGRVLKSNLADATLISELITAFPHHLRTSPLDIALPQFLQYESQFRPCSVCHWRRHLHRLVPSRVFVLQGLVSDPKIFDLQATTPSTRHSHSFNTKKSRLASPRHFLTPPYPTRVPIPPLHQLLSKTESPYLNGDDVALKPAL